MKKQNKYNTTVHRKLWWKYTAMKRRCNSRNYSRYEDYGGRGIKVCDEWNSSFDAFAEWAYTHGYKDGLTLERIDVDGDYCPENCTFITLEEQAKNKRNTIWIDYHGEKVRLKDICQREGRNYSMVRRRIELLGWNPERAVQEPSEKDRISLAQKCREHNISRNVVQDRIWKLGWDEERALTTPVRSCKRKEVN